MDKTLKTFLLVAAVFSFFFPAHAHAQTNTVHIWALPGGKTIQGNYVSAGNTMVVIRVSGTNYFMPIANISSNDLDYFKQCNAIQVQERLEVAAEAAANAPKLRLIDAAVMGAGHDHYILGSAQNISGKPLAVATVGFSLYKRGFEANYLETSTINLAPDEVWKFQIDDPDYESGSARPTIQLKKLEATIAEQ